MGLPEPKYDLKNIVKLRNPRKWPQTVYVSDNRGRTIPQGWEPGIPLPMGYPSLALPWLQPPLLLPAEMLRH